MRLYAAWAFLGKHWYALLALLFVLALAVRMIPPVHDLREVDPFHHLQITEQAAAGAAPQEDPYFFQSVALLSKTVGVSLKQLAMALPAIFGALQVVLVFLIGRKIGGNANGLIAGAFSALSYGAVWINSKGYYENDSMGVALLLLAVLLSFYAKDAVVELLRREKQRSAQLIGSTAVATKNLGLPHEKTHRNAQLKSFRGIVFSKANILNAILAVALSMLIVLRRTYASILIDLSLALLLLILGFTNIRSKNSQLRLLLFSAIALIATMLYLKGVWEFGFFGGIALIAASFALDVVLSLGFRRKETYAFVAAFAILFFALLSTVNLSAIYERAAVYLAPAKGAGWLSIVSEQQGLRDMGDAGVTTFLWPVFGTLVPIILVGFYAYAKHLLRNRQAVYTLPALWSAAFLALMFYRVHFAIYAAFAFALFAAQTLLVLRESLKGIQSRLFPLLALALLVPNAYYGVTMAAAALDEPTLELRPYWYDAFNWINNNTQRSEQVLAFSDYGYWLEYYTNRTYLLTPSGGGPLAETAAFYINGSAGVLKNYDVKYVVVDIDLFSKVGAFCSLLGVRNCGCTYVVGQASITGMRCNSPYFLLTLFDLDVYPGLTLVYEAGGGALRIFRVTPENETRSDWVLYNVKQKLGRISEAYVVMDVSGSNPGAVVVCGSEISRSLAMLGKRPIPYAFNGNTCVDPQQKTKTSADCLREIGGMTFAVQEGANNTVLSGQQVITTGDAEFLKACAIAQALRQI